MKVGDIVVCSGGQPNLSREAEHHNWWRVLERLPGSTLKVKLLYTPRVTRGFRPGYLTTVPEHSFRPMTSIEAGIVSVLCF